MGVIYKFKKEVIDYITEKKKKDPAISCRKLVSLVKQEFNKKVSKSSINSVIKGSGLSMPVGRRCVLEQGSYEFKSAGIFFLKAADWLLGGSLSIAETVNKCLGFNDPGILSKIEYLIYGNLFEFDSNKGNAADLSFCGLTAESINIEEDMQAYLLHLQTVKELCPGITRIISGLSKEIHGLKLNLTDKSVIYLDGQLHTVWPSPKIPNGFSATLYDGKRCIKKIFLENNPLVLFMSPGYNAPTAEFFDFILSLNGQKSISSIVLLDNNLTEIETMPLQDISHKHFVIFGIWPWQFGQYREIKSMGEFKPFYYIPADKNYYIAETVIEFSQHNGNKRIILNGCVLKKTLKGKEILSIYTNLSFEQLKPEEIAAIYLNKWPNLEEGFINFSRSIENFVRGSKDKAFLDIEKFSVNPSLSIKKVLDSYLIILDSFVRLNFLPDRYEKDDFAAIKDKFYDLKGIWTVRRNEVIIKFSPSAGYSNIKELKYVCNRVNERNAFINGGKKLWLLV